MCLSVGRRCHVPENLLGTRKWDIRVALYAKGGALAADCGHAPGLPRRPTVPLF